MSYIRIRRIPCGRHCPTCPHGPYAYLGRRAGKRIIEEYLGRCGSIADMKKLRLRHGQTLFERVESAVISQD